MLSQPIINIPEICAQKAIHHVVLSPGSRCAPLTIAFVRHPNIQVKTISDERSAAFIALGMAQQLQQAVALVCTSGTAAYNYAPAIAEAFYQYIPLLVFTADRPPEWIGQREGQTIHQKEIYGNHVKKSFDLPVDSTHTDAQWHIHRIISEAINLSTTFPQGPVHINVPLREPLYLLPDESIHFDQNIKIIDQVPCCPMLDDSTWEKILYELPTYQRVLLLAGQQQPAIALLKTLEAISQHMHLPVLGDILSNLHPSEQIIRHYDGMLMQKDAQVLEALQPDLLISFGKSVLSKNLKLFLRKNPPKAHWHIQPAGDVADTFQVLTKIIPVAENYFFKLLLKKQLENNRGVHDKQKSFFSCWHAQAAQHKDLLPHFFSKQTWNEFAIIQLILKNLPANAQLHLGNSMPVRYANFIGLTTAQNNITVYGNRGTSGIDGTNGTAVGASLATHKPVVLLTGDMAFLYDKNAFWHNYHLKTLRIIVLNNHGGGIFGLIDGPAQQPELAEYFETQQRANAKAWAQEFGMVYLYSENFPALNQQLGTFFQKDEKTKLLEIKTEKSVNRCTFNHFKTLFSCSKSKNQKP